MTCQDSLATLSFRTLLTRMVINNTQFHVLNGVGMAKSPAESNQFILNEGAADASHPIVLLIPDQNPELVTSN